MSRSTIGTADLRCPMPVAARQPMTRRSRARRDRRCCRPRPLGPARPDREQASDSGADVPDPTLPGASAAGLDDTVTESPSATTWMTRGWSTTIGCSNRMSDSADASCSAAAAESVCSRTDTGTSSAPWIRWDPGYGLASRASRACHRCAGGVVATTMCCTEQGAGSGRGIGCLRRILDGYPVLRVMPGRGGQDRMRLGRVRCVRRWASGSC